MYVSRDDPGVPLRLRLLPLLSVKVVGPEAGCQYYRIYRMCGPPVVMVKVVALSIFTRRLVVSKFAMGRNPIDFIGLYGSLINTTPQAILARRSAVTWGSVALALPCRHARTHAHTYSIRTAAPFIEI